MSVSTLPNVHRGVMHVSHGGLAASAIVQSIAGMELREQSVTDAGPSKQSTAQAAANSGNFMTDIIDNVKV